MNIPPTYTMKIIIKTIFGKIKFKIVLPTVVPIKHPGSRRLPKW